MSTEDEKLLAQKGAFNHKPTQRWHRHLMGPAELSILMEKAREYDCGPNANPHTASDDLAVRVECEQPRTHMTIRQRDELTNLVLILLDSGATQVQITRLPPFSLE